MELQSTHVWRQTWTQSNINNFYEEDFNILHPRKNDRGSGDGISRMEFPLMQWCFAGFYKVFGNKLLYSRILSFLLGVLSLLGIYKLIGFLFRDRVLALIGVFCLSLSPTFFYYAVCPMPDNMALTAGIWGLYHAVVWQKNKQKFYLLSSFILLSISALCKLPFVLYFAFPAVVIILDVCKSKDYKVFVKHTLSWFIFLFPPFIWYATVIPGWGGNGILHGIFTSNVSEVLELVFFNLSAVLPEMLLGYASLPLFLLGLFVFFRDKKFRQNSAIPFIALGVLLVLYAVFEINMIAKIHDYYLFPFFPLLVIVLALGARYLRSLKGIKGRLLLLLCLTALPFTTSLRMQIRWQPDRLGFQSDLLAYKDELRAAAPKDALCVAGNDVSHYIFFYYIDKKGWGFHDDQLSPEKLKIMISQGATYLYCDSESLLINKDFSPLLDSLVFRTPQIEVYKLMNIDSL
jgi:hypothetical protein